MKIKWNEGRPKKSGYYLTWNTAEDPYPTVLHCSINDNEFEWWVYYTHKAVLDDIKSQVYLDLKDEYNKFLLRTVSKTSKSLLEKIIKEINEIDEYNDEQITLNYRDSGGACLYDVGRPEYWAELPYLFYVDNDSDSWNPNDFDVEIEDTKATVISKLTRDIEYILGKTLSELNSPFEKGEAPWVSK